MTQTKNDFSSGLVDPILGSQINNPIVQNGLLDSMNFIPLPGGGITRRRGTRMDSVGLPQGYGNLGSCYLIETKNFKNWIVYGTAKVTVYTAGPTDLIVSQVAARADAWCYAPNNAGRIAIDYDNDRIFFTAFEHGSTTKQVLITQGVNEIQQFLFMRTPITTPVYWTAIGFTSGTRVFYGGDGKVYKSNAVTVGTDVPSISGKWVLDETGAVGGPVIQPFAQSWDGTSQYVKGDSVFLAGAGAPYLFTCTRTPPTVNTVPTNVTYFTPVGTPLLGANSDEVRDICVFQNRLWILGKGKLIASRINSFFDIMPSGTDEAGAINFTFPASAHILVPINQGVFVGCKRKEYFIYNPSGDPITAAPKACSVMEPSLLGIVAPQNYATTAPSVSMGDSAIVWTNSGFARISAQITKESNPYISQHFLSQIGDTPGFTTSKRPPISMDYDPVTRFYRINMTGPVKAGTDVPPGNTLFMGKDMGTFIALFPVSNNAFDKQTDFYGNYHIGHNSGRIIMGKGNILMTDEYNPFDDTVEQGTCLDNIQTISSGTFNLPGTNTWYNKDLVIQRRDGTVRLVTQNALFSTALLPEDRPTVGLNYAGVNSTAGFKTTAFGVSPDATVSIKKITMNLYKSLGGRVRVNGGDWQNIDYSKLTVDGNGLYSGFVEVYASDTFDGIGAGKSVEVDCNGPYPFTCLGITADMVGGNV